MLASLEADTWGKLESGTADGFSIRRSVCRLTAIIKKDENEYISCYIRLIINIILTWRNKVFNAEMKTANTSRLSRFILQTEVLRPNAISLFITFRGKSMKRYSRLVSLLATRNTANCPVTKNWCCFLSVLRFPGIYTVNLQISRKNTRLFSAHFGLCNRYKRKNDYGIYSFSPILSLELLNITYHR